MDVTLPVGTTILFFDASRGIDPIARSAMRMPEARFLRWVALYDLKPSDFRGERRYLLGPDEGHWKPTSRMGVRVSQVDLGGGSILNIGYEIDEAGVATVYLMVHGT